MGLSSNILWHQTQYANLLRIIKSKEFLCSYSLEEVDGIIGRKVALPMVSMCDLPISDFTEFQGRYGGYSIGLSHEWGVKKKFNPLWYYEPKSRVPQLLRKLFDIALAGEDDSILSLMGIVSYMKKMEGPLPNHNYSLYRFYDEREVRYVPSFDYLKSGGVKPVLTEDEYQEYKLQHKNGPVINASVSFEWSDVRYIIVKEDRQISSMIEYLAKQGCDNKAIGVFSAKQIDQDFIGYRHNVEIQIDKRKEVDNDKSEKILKLTIEKLKELIG